MMLKKVLIVFVMAITLVGGSMARAAEVTQAHLAEVDAVINAGDVLYTIYNGMSVKDLMANFKGASQWTIVDGGEIKNLDPNVHHRYYYIYRNIGELDPVYEVIQIHTDDNNEHVWAYSVIFFTKSEKIARAMFNKATNENKIKYGMPNVSRGKHQTGVGNEKGELFLFDSLGTNIWNRPGTHMTGWEHMEGQSAEVVSKAFCLPEIMNYRIYMT